MRHDFILGIFDKREQAEEAVGLLQDLGFAPKEISIIVKDETIAFGVEQTTGANVATGIVEGATSGGVVGGIVGLLVGIGAIAIPGIGAVLIGGPLALALGLTGAAATTVSAAATGALAGGIIGALVGLGVPEETARYYDTRLKEGAILLAVSPTDTIDAHQIQQVFSETNAQQVQYLH